MQKQHVTSDSHLQTGHQWSDQSHLFFFLGTVSLQLQGWCTPISLRPVLGVVAVHVMATVWSSCN